MEENKIETPLSEMDSNQSAIGDIRTEEVNQTEREVESNGTSVEASDKEADEKKQKSMEYLPFNQMVEWQENPVPPNISISYRSAERIGERRRVSKKENKKKKAKRRMAKKSKR